MLFNIISISLGAILINNFIFSQFLGCCPFLGCSNKTDTAFGMGVAVIFVMGMASAICWLIDTYILVPLGLAFLETLAFILIIAALVQLVEMFLKKSVPALYSALGIYLPLITTNCAVLGAALLNISEGYTFLESVLYGFSAALGFTLAIVLFAGVRERLKYADPPKAFVGFPLLLITAGLVAMAFSGFSGFSFS
jgi:electron transport complex protein RnfA